jgi:predicted amidohydrolase YtcJ
MLKTRLALLSGMAFLVVQPAAAHPSAPADVVFRNGYVYTVDEADSVREAVAVRYGRIIEVGSDEQIAALVGPNTTVIDLQGRMLMPGLIDGHVHPSSAGAQLRTCNLQYLPLTQAQFVDRIQECLDAGEPGLTTPLSVTGWYRQFMQPTGTDADVSLLDRLRTSRPVFISNRDGHSILVNRRALEMAGIDRDTQDPPGGKIIRDAQGEPTGILEDDADGLLAPLRAPRTSEDDVADLKAALRGLSGKGVTTIFDAIAAPPSLTAYNAIRNAGELTVRVHGAPLIDAAGAADPDGTIERLNALRQEYSAATPTPEPDITIRYAKIFMDGVIQAPAQTAGLLAPYHVNTGTEVHPHWQPGQHSGEIYIAPQVLNPLVLKLAQAGYDAHIHAIGDRAVRIALDSFENMRRQVKDTSIRSAIAHAELVHPDDYARFAELDVIPLMSFQWAIPGPNTVTGAKTFLGEERFNRMEPIASLSNASTRVGYGSDWPVDQLNYWLAFQGAISRTGDGRWGPEFTGRLNDEPGIARKLALRGMTIYPAWELHQEAETGSIETGKLADLIVLDRNVMQAPLDQLAGTKVLLTMVGGEIVHNDGILP